MANIDSRDGGGAVDDEVVKDIIQDAEAATEDTDSDEEPVEVQEAETEQETSSDAASRFQRLRDRAREAATNTAEKTKETASNAGRTIKRTVGSEARLGAETAEGDIGEASRDLEKRVLDENDDLNEDDVRIDEEDGKLVAKLNESGREKRQEARRQQVRDGVAAIRQKIEAIEQDPGRQDALQQQAIDRQRDGLEGLGTSERQLSADEINRQLRDRSRPPANDPDEFVDYDWSFGLGDPDVDEVEGAANQFDDWFQGFAGPAVSTESAVRDTQLQAGFVQGIAGAPTDVLETGENAWFVLENKRNPGFDSPEQSSAKTQNILDASDFAVEQGRRTGEYVRNNPGEATGAALAGFALGSGSVATARRLGDVDLPNKPGSFRADTRGQSGWGSKTIEVEKTIQKPTDILGDGDAAQRARQRLPPESEFESIDEYEREWARLTARERFADRGVPLEELDDYDIRGMESRVFEEWGLDGVEDTLAATTSRTTTTTTTQAAAGSLGGGTLGGLSLSLDAPRRTQSRSASAAGLFGDLDAQESTAFADDDLFGDGYLLGDSASDDVFGDTTTTTDLSDDIFADPGTVTTSMTATSTAGETDDYFRNPDSVLDGGRRSRRRTAPDFGGEPNGGLSDDGVGFGSDDELLDSGIADVDELLK